MLNFLVMGAILWINYYIIIPRITDVQFFDFFGEVGDVRPDYAPDGNINQLAINGQTQAVNDQLQNLRTVLIDYLALQNAGLLTT